MGNKKENKLVDILEEIKNCLGITIEDSDIDTNIRLKTQAVQQYLIKGGAPKSVGSTPQEISCIAIGVNDLLNQKAGETKFSSAFAILANQICGG